MKIPHTIAAATLLALGTALFSGANNFIGKIGVSAVADPILFTTLKNGLVALLLLALFVAYRRVNELKILSRSQWIKLISIGAIGGALPFALFFTGLSMTQAVNGAIIHKTLVLWVLLLSYPFLKERLSPTALIGIAAIVIANYLLGGFKSFAFGVGEWMILAATILWAVENIIAKKALANISTLTVVSARMILGSGILLTFLFVTGRVTPVLSISGVAWGWTIFSAVLLFGFVTTWYAALKRAPAVYVAALLVPATLVTSTLSAIFVTNTFTVRQLSGFVLTFVGVSLLWHYGRKLSASSDVPSSAIVSATR